MTSDRSEKKQLPLLNQVHDTFHLTELSVDITTMAPTRDTHELRTESRTTKTRNLSTIQVEVAMLIIGSQVSE